jgi:hypothetical protein
MRGARANVIRTLSREKVNCSFTNRNLMLNLSRSS